MDLNTWTNGESQDPGRMIHPLFYKNTISKKIKAEFFKKFTNILRVMQVTMLIKVSIAGFQCHAIQNRSK